jgi:TonB family protein
MGPGDYPSEAKDKGWEGTSQIEVRFATGGYIRNILVGDSTGHALLDEKAVDWARGLQYPDVPAELRDRDFTVSFPVVFRLR